MPSQNSALGATSTWDDVRIGLWVASTSAKIAVRTSAMTSRPPAAPRGFFFTKSHERRRPRAGPRAARSAGRSSMACAPLAITPSRT